MDHSVLEDLGLFGSEEITGLEDERDHQFNDAGASVRAPGSLPPSRPSSSIVYDPLGFSRDEVETDLEPLDLAGVDIILASERRNSYFRHESNLVNAVHMHVQDNARIPNYNLPVDRSNSNNNTTSDALLSSKLSSNIELINYAELFLSSESGYRKSLNQNYEVRGRLSSSDVQKEIEVLAAAASLDPTPWSEIKDKIHIEEEKEKQQQQVQRHHQQQQQIYVRTSAPVARTPTMSPRAATIMYPNDGQREIDFINGRKIPSPKKNTAGQEVARMADALATAAAIAQTNNGAANVVSNNASISPAKQSKLATVTGREASTMPSIPAVNQIKMEVDYSHAHDRHLQRQYANAKPPPRADTHDVSRASVLAATNRKPQDNLYTRDRHLQRQRANAKAPPHAAAHAVSRASLLAATNRKSQYGFGGNHTVPSVPAPPSFRSSNQSILSQKTVQKNNQTPKKAIATFSVKPHIQVPSPPSHIPNGSYPVLHVEGNTGSAYERKKQKAKDARVRLNEAIECLAVAVNLAGSQSKLRIDQLQNQIHTTEIRQKSIEVNQEGIKLAESAKKWDRPSFVGTAASVIKALNAQCETLMAELMAMQQMLDESKSINGGSNNDDKVKSEDSTRDDAIYDTKMAASPTDITNTEVSEKIEQVESPDSHQVQKRYKQSADLMKNVQSPNKRPRLGIKEETQNLSCTDEVCWGKMSKLISEWLDPVALCRCQCTSKGWRDMDAFGNEQIWFDLAVKRFGLYNVRKWSEHLKDEENEEIYSKYLYMEMNDKNVMPHFSRKGLLFLGNGKIQGKLSAWAFIVERSNGETLRSVKRDPSSGTLRGVGYQSRPVVELRIVIQNIGMFTHPAIVKSQQVEVDVSTRRTDTKFEEIYWDDRLKKVVRNTDGTIRSPPTIHSNSIFQDEICQLEYLETAVIEVHINARGCSTISKFRKRSNFTTILAYLDGTTVPMVIPFLKHNDMF
jgi:hypothetical protein